MGDGSLKRRTFCKDELRLLASSRVNGLCLSLRPKRLEGFSAVEKDRRSRGKTDQDGLQFWSPRCSKELQGEQIGLHREVSERRHDLRCRRSVSVNSPVIFDTRTS